MKRSSSNTNSFHICVTTSKAPALLSSSSSSTTAAGCAAQLILKPFCTASGGESSSSGATSSNSSTVPLWNYDTKCLIKSIQLIPSSAFGTTRNFLVYGGTNLSTDMYAMLVGSSDSDQNKYHVKWKTRLPETPITTGLIVSNCGTYVIGGSSKGNCYLWDVLQTTSPNLIRVWKSHYRSVTVIKFTPDNEHLLVGGADGILHMYALVDLVEASSGSSESIHPRCTWSEHHLDVTDVYFLSEHRFVSVSLDMQLCIMDMFNKNVLAKVNMPSGITCITGTTLFTNTSNRGQCLFVGCQNSIVYKVDVDALAMARTIDDSTIQLQQENSVKNNYTMKELFQSAIHVAQSFENVTTTDNNHHNASHNNHNLMEFRGHSRSITCVTYYCKNNDASPPLLISGDSKGCIRFWNVQTGICLKVMYPWNTGTTSSSTTLSCPISSIVIVPNNKIQTEHNSLFGRSGNLKHNKRRKSGLADHTDAASFLFQPLTHHGAGGGTQTQHSTHAAATTDGSSSNLITDDEEGCSDFVFLGAAQNSKGSSTLRTRTNQTKRRERLLRKAQKEVAQLLCHKQDSPTTNGDAANHHREAEAFMNNNNNNNNNNSRLGLEMNHGSTTNDHVNYNNNTSVAPAVPVNEHFVEQLKDELRDSRHLVHRWEVVANRLYTRLLELDPIFFNNEEQDEEMTPRT